MPKTIIVPEQEGWDNVNQSFVNLPGGKIKIEHSLLSIAKWEAITEKSFLDSRGFTPEQFILYVKCMTINNVDKGIYQLLTEDNLKEIRSYMEKPMTATHFTDRPMGRSREQNTSEMIYYQMFSLGIDISCERWHINRLLTLIQLMSRMNEQAYDPKKGHRRLTAAEIDARNDLNNARKKALGTNG